MLRLSAGPVSFHHFGALLEEATSITSGRKYPPAAVICNGVDRVAVYADEVIGNREVVAKHIGLYLVHLGGIVGATMLGDGEIVLVYNSVVFT